MSEGLFLCVLNGLLGGALYAYASARGREHGYWHALSDFRHQAERRGDKSSIEIVERLERDAE